MVGLKVVLNGFKVVLLVGNGFIDYILRLWGYSRLSGFADWGILTHKDTFKQNKSVHSGWNVDVIYLMSE